MGVVETLNKEIVPRVDKYFDRTGLSDALILLKAFGEGTLSSAIYHWVP